VVLWGLSFLELAEEMLAERLFIQFNNTAVRGLYARKKPGIVLMLFPQSFQTDTCEADLKEDPCTCSRCGNCQVPDLLDLADEFKVDIHFYSETNDAVLYVKELHPALVISPESEERLSKGLLRALPGRVCLPGSSASPKADTVNIDRVREALRYFS